MTKNLQLNIRKAIEEDASALTEIAHAAKRHWGYPEEWIAQWREQLTVTAEYIVRHHVAVAVVDGRAQAFYALRNYMTYWELDHFWVHPGHIGRGIGTALFRHVLRRANEDGPDIIQIDSDPNAEGFYRRMGAVRVGHVDGEVSGVDRVLPRLAVKVSAVCKDVE